MAQLSREEQKQPIPTKQEMISSKLPQHPIKWKWYAKGESRRETPFEPKIRQKMPNHILRQLVQYMKRWDIRNEYELRLHLGDLLGHTVLLTVEDFDKCYDESRDFFEFLIRLYSGERALLLVITETLNENDRKRIKKFLVATSFIKFAELERFRQQVSNTKWLSTRRNDDQFETQFGIPKTEIAWLESIIRPQSQRLCDDLGIDNVQEWAKSIVTGDKDFQHMPDRQFEEKYHLTKHWAFLLLAYSLWGWDCYALADIVKKQSDIAKAHKKNTVELRQWAYELHDELKKIDNGTLLDGEFYEQQGIDPGDAEYIYIYFNTIDRVEMGDEYIESDYEPPSDEADWTVYDWKIYFWENTPYYVNKTKKQVNEWAEEAVYKHMRKESDDDDEW